MAALPHHDVNQLARQHDDLYHLLAGQVRLDLVIGQRRLFLLFLGAAVDTTMRARSLPFTCTGISSASSRARSAL